MVVVTTQPTVHHKEKMQPPTYTTLPLSGADVISRSIQNTTSFISTHRPWSELISSDALTKPESVSVAVDRIKTNAIYFRINYAIIILICTLICLVGSPFTLLVFGLILWLWLVLYFFREDQLVLRGVQVNDHLVFVVLISVSVLCVWFMGFFGNLVLGVGFGLVLMGIHGVFRNPDGLFLNEEQAVSAGFVRSSGTVSSLNQSSGVHSSKPR